MKKLESDPINCEIKSLLFKVTQVGATCFTTIGTLCHLHSGKQDQKGPI